MSKPNNTTPDMVSAMRQVRDALDVAIKTADKSGFDEIRIAVPAARLYRRELTEHINAMRKPMYVAGATETRVFSALPSRLFPNEPNWTKRP